MTVEYTWQITGLKTSTLNNTPNVVVQTYWKKIGKDGESIGTFVGATPFSADSMPAGTTFIPFEQLTEADVLEWIKAVVVGGYEDHVNAKIQEEIDRQKNPVNDVSLPWSVSETTNTTV
jgi:hypothetical protein